jgi:Ankyrin repeats (many copies)
MTSKESTQDRDQDKELLERYRRASDTDTAAPSEAVRAAILAEGRRAADARAKELRGQPFDASRPAANDSRWKITAFGTAGAALLAALLFAPNLWKTVPPSPSASASAPAPADAAQSSTAAPSPELESFQSRPQEAAEQPKATGLQRRSESQRPPPQRKTEAFAQSDALAEKAAPQNYTAPQPTAPSAVPSVTPPATASTSTAPAFSGGVPAASSARGAKIPPVSSLIAGRFSGMPSEPRQEALQSAAASGDAVQAATLLDQGVPLDARDEQGRTPLMRAVMQNRLEVVRLLLNRGADPNLADNTGSTPLQQAKREKLSDIAAMLQRAGAR